MHYLFSTPVCEQPQRESLFLNETSSLMFHYMLEKLLDLARCLNYNPSCPVYSQSLFNTSSNYCLGSSLCLSDCGTVLSWLFHMLSFCLFSLRILCPRTFKRVLMSFRFEWLHRDEAAQIYLGPLREIPCRGPSPPLCTARRYIVPFSSDSKVLFCAPSWVFPF